jgi:hypothetical protein
VSAPSWASMTPPTHAGLTADVFAVRDGTSSRWSAVPAAAKESGTYLAASSSGARIHKRRRFVRLGRRPDWSCVMCGSSVCGPTPRLRVTTPCMSPSSRRLDLGRSRSALSTPPSAGRHRLTTSAGGAARNLRRPCPTTPAGSGRSARTADCSTRICEIVDAPWSRERHTRGRRGRSGVPVRCCLVRVSQPMPRASSLRSRSSTQLGASPPPGSATPASLRQRASPRSVKVCHAMIRSSRSCVPDARV